MLTLPIKKNWFELITLGVKTEEYRELTEYWIKRMRHERYVQDVPENYCGLRLRIRNGYRKDAPSAVITLSKIDRGPGLEAWGAEKGKEYLRLHIAKVDNMEDTREENKKSESGEWLFHSHNPSYSPFDGSPSDLYQCSNCGYVTGDKTDYCPKCGNMKKRP